MRQFTKAFFGTVSVIAVMAAADAAQADKKSGTLNIAAQQQFEGVSPIFGSPGSAQLYTQVVFDSLVNFDPDAGKFVPALAESWKRVDPTTWEFKLRKGVKFHDGSEFDADDVVYTIDWVIDPKVRFRAKSNFSWIKQAEKIDSHTVRITTKRPFARALGFLSHRPKIFPSDLHGSLVDCGGAVARRSRGGQGQAARGGQGGARKGGQAQAAKGGKGGKSQTARGGQGGAAKGRQAAAGGGQARAAGGGQGRASVKTNAAIVEARRAGKCKSNFGRRSPVGTGAYRVAAMDGTRGLTLEAADNSVHANSVKPVPSIKRINIRIIPDSQARVAQMLTGKIDMTRVFTKDVGVQMGKDPRFAVTVVNGLRYNFLTLDAADRTGVGYFKDVRVRRAIAHAINRDELREKVVVGGEKAFKINALCVPFQVNCSSTVDLPDFDPVKARKLLAEAGYPDGFEMTISSIPLSRDVAVAMSGYLKNVGIKAKIQSPPLSSFIRMSRQNKLHALTFTYGSSTIADAGTPIFFHFFPSPRDFSRNPVMNKFAKANDTILDPAKRAKAIQDAFDYNNRELFILPLSGAPQVFVHTKDLAMPTTALNGYGAVLNRLKWK